MNVATAIAFAVAGVFAVGDWVAKARANRRLEYLCKPATLAALIAAAIVLDPVANAQDRRVWFVVALCFSLVGDVLLMLPRDLFIGGLSAFALAHVAYIVGFWTAPPGATEFLLAMLVVVVLLVPLVRRILVALGTQPEMRAPVVVYIGVITLMVASALASANVLATAGAALFAGSDAMIAWDRFVRRLAWAPVAIMVTYHLGQAALVASLLR